MKLSSVAVAASAEIWTFAGILLGSLVLLHFLYVRLLRRAAQNTRLVHASDSGQRIDHWLPGCMRAIGLPAFVLIWTFGLRLLAWRVVPLLSASPEDATRLTSAINMLTGAVIVACAFWLLLRIGRAADTQLRALAGRTSTPIDDILLPLAGRGIRVLLPLIAILFFASSLELDLEWRGAIRDGTSILIIAAVAYLLFQFTGALQAFVLVRHPLEAGNDYRPRAVRTQVKVLRRLAVVLIGLLAFASMLMVFDSVRRFGTTLLASAGVAGVVVGFAAQRSIATLLAGFQIAITQPIRLDDNVIVENEFGRVEEITLTYVVLALWDLRRLVVPITWFIEKPFQNWTRTSSQLLGTVFLYLDYQVPLESLRAEFERIVHESSLWDRQVCGMQVTDTKENHVEIRGLVSASDSGKLWDLRCEVREKLLKWLSETFPGALPRARVQLAPAVPRQHVA